MRAIKIPKQDREIFLQAAESVELEFTMLKKIKHPTLEFYHCTKFNISQHELFLLGIFYQKLKDEKLKFQKFS